MTCLYLLNGWAMGPNALLPLSQALEKKGFQTQTISLDTYCQPTLQQSLHVLKKLIPPYSSVVGWSLGGMLAQQLARTQSTAIYPPLLCRRTRVGHGRFRLVKS